MVYELVPTKERLYTIGRLDRDSEGLILLTNDGDLSLRLTHPKFEIEKKYRVRITGHITQAALNRIVRDGVNYDGVQYSIKGANIKRASKVSTTINFILTEGKKREIRQVCKALNLRVVSLKRMEFAGLRLGKLPTGHFRDLNSTEVKRLQSFASNKK